MSAQQTMSEMLLGIVQDLIEGLVQLEDQGVHRAGLVRIQAQARLIGLLGNLPRHMAAGLVRRPTESLPYVVNPEVP